MYGSSLVMRGAVELRWLEFGGRGWLEDFGGELVVGELLVGEPEVIRQQGGASFSFFCVESKSKNENKINGIEIDKLRALSFKEWESERVRE
ncbi:unnamed protein product [Ambrosiozyma monospora]|uniref:Unnamed protein product n=1 Tax=Ambrosiozyma monospora TaxID=43982 RepID=A0ACB5TT98_AMBMO|nr:unnamed protein product [Ambrosiozyma monospora]